MTKVEELQREIEENDNIMNSMIWVALSLKGKKECDSDEKKLFKIAVKTIKDKAETILQEYKELKDNNIENIPNYKTPATNWLNDLGEVFGIESYEIDIGNDGRKDNLDLETVRGKVSKIAEEIVILLRMRVKWKLESYDDIDVKDALEKVVKEKEHELKEIRDKNPRYSNNIENIINPVLLYDKIISNSIFKKSNSRVLERYDELLKTCLIENKVGSWISSFTPVYEVLVLRKKGEEKSKEIEKDMEELSRIAPELAEELKEFLRENFEQGDSEQGDSEQVDSKKKGEKGR